MSATQQQRHRNWTASAQRRAPPHPSSGSLRNMSAVAMRCKPFSGPMWRLSKNVSMCAPYFSFSP
jgi:hypothetical protein